MKIEVGKYYRTRDGKKVGPMSLYDGDSMSANTPGSTGLWNFDGTAHFSWANDSPQLIAEWTDEPATIGTLDEICAKVGDVVENVTGRYILNVCQNNLEFIKGGSYRIISRAPTGPVRTVTRKEIVPGVYGKLSVLNSDGWWFAFTHSSDKVAHIKLSRADLIAARDVFNQLIDALEE